MFPLMGGFLNVQHVFRSPLIGDQRRDKEETLLNVQYVFRSPLNGDQRRDKEETFSDHP